MKARLSEDEAAAEPLEHSWITAADAATAAFSHRFDPARMLREVEAKRAILDEHTNWTCCGDFNGQPQDALRTVVRHLATAYSDHPDYDPVWKP